MNYHRWLKHQAHPRHHLDLVCIACHCVSGASSVSIVSLVFWREEFTVVTVLWALLPLDLCWSVDFCELGLISDSSATGPACGMCRMNLCFLWMRVPACWLWRGEDCGLCVCGRAPFGVGYTVYNPSHSVMSSPFHTSMFSPHHWSFF